MLQQLDLLLHEGAVDKARAADASGQRHSRDNFGLSDQSRGSPHTAGTEQSQLVCTRQPMG
jgi:hypothetical protein